ncbi:hypothetical protein BGZ79_004852 [Entomortierella chlamydospora]|nr:hypothetical protein BGZ79_004852 [Entomortierella chlamydospora]
MNETMRPLLRVHENPLPYSPNVRILFVPKMYSRLLPMDSKVAKEFKIRYYALLFESSKAQDLKQWAEKRLLPRLTQEQKLDLIHESWRQIPCSTIERSSMAFLTNVQFLQEARPKSVPETEIESVENILKEAMSEFPKLISYYKNQDKDTGPSLRMREQVDKIKRDSEIQPSNLGI